MIYDDLRRTSGIWAKSHCLFWMCCARQNIWGTARAPEALISYFSSHDVMWLQCYVYRRIPYQPYHYIGCSAFGSDIVLARWHSWLTGKDAHQKRSWEKDPPFGRSQLPKGSLLQLSPRSAGTPARESGQARIRRKPSGVDFIDVPWFAGHEFHEFSWSHRYSWLNESNPLKL